ncbi:hypothetical protein [Streptomyces sp. NPDC046859]|uniref:hypothetical protein n=1 Tax=Streptomyces sp. NPDC046859 TaxID=3155734 RepID=UPI0033D5F375
MPAEGERRDGAAVGGYPGTVAGRDASSAAGYEGVPPQSSVHPAASRPGTGTPMPAEAAGRGASSAAGYEGVAPQSSAHPAASRPGTGTPMPAEAARRDASSAAGYQGVPPQSSAHSAASRSGTGTPMPADSERRDGTAAGGYPGTAARRDASSAAGYEGVPPQSSAHPAASGPGTGTPMPAEAARRDASSAAGYEGVPPQSSAHSAASRSGTGTPMPAESERRDGAAAGGYPGTAARPASRAPGEAPERAAPRPPAPRQPERAPQPRRGGAPAETSAETTFRLRPVPSEPSAAAGGTGTPTRPAPGVFGAPPVPPRNPSTGHAPGVSAPDPSLSWTAPTPPPPGRPVVSFGEPEGYDERARPRPLGLRIRPRTALAAACVVLGLGLIGGALTGSWLVGEPGDDGAQGTFAAAGSLWHSIPVDRLFPPTVDGKGAGPGGADRTWTRIAVAPDTGCANAFDPLLRKALAPAGCRRLLRATYIDATQSHVTTVGLLFTNADPATMRSLDTRFTRDGLDRRADLVPRPYAPQGTLAAGFGDAQRAAWTVSVLTDAPVVVYAVSGWADDRVVARPEPAEEAMRAGATSAVAQAGLGHEARGLADRVERTLRRDVGPSAEPSS